MTSDCRFQTAVPRMAEQAPCTSRLCEYLCRLLAIVFAFIAEAAKIAVTNMYNLPRKRTGQFELHELGYHHVPENKYANMYVPNI